MGKRTDGPTDRGTDERTDELMDGRTDGCLLPLDHEPGPDDVYGV